MPALEPNEPLMVVRSELWRFAVRLSEVDRVLNAAMPVGLPSASATVAVQLPDGLVPVVFAASLFGADEVSLEPADKMVVLGTGDRRTILWVDAVEDVVPFVPLPEGAAAPVDGAWVSCVSGGDQTLAVVDSKSLHAAARAQS